MVEKVINKPVEHKLPVYKILNLTSETKDMPSCTAKVTCQCPGCGWVGTVTRYATKVKDFKPEGEVELINGILTWALDHSRAHRGPLEYEILKGFKIPVTEKVLNFIRLKGMIK